MSDLVDLIFTEEELERVLELLDKAADQWAKKLAADLREQAGEIVIDE